VDLTESLQDLLSKPNALYHIEEYCKEHGFASGARIYFQYINPNHKWQIVANKVVFHMENGDMGYVSTVHPDGSFVITAIDDHGDGPCKYSYNYTIKRLNDDFNPLVGYNGNGSKEVVNVCYVPFRVATSVFGHEVFPSVEYFVSVHEDRAEEYGKNHPEI